MSRSNGQQSRYFDFLGTINCFTHEILDEQPVATLLLEINHISI